MNEPNPRIAQIVKNLPPLDLKRPDIAGRNTFFAHTFNYLRFNNIAGDYVEFGCASAKTFRLVSNFIRQTGLPMKQWAFDSFAGLPAQEDGKDFHPRWKEGDFAMKLDMFEAIVGAYGVERSAYEVVPGYYYDTIGPNAQKRPQSLPQDIALAYIDCDLHSSTADVLYFLKPRLKTGMVIAFDDYFCYADGVKSGERLAMLEFLKQNPEWQFVPYQNIYSMGFSFIVEKQD